MKRIIFHLYAISGLVRLARWCTRKRLKILLYHGVAPSNGHVFNYRRKFVAPASFERQIAFLAKHYTILPLDEAIKRLYAGTLPCYALAITFDDGYRNNYEFAFPTLKRYGAPATIFLATDFVFEKKPLWVDRLEYTMEQSDGTPMEKRTRDDTLRAELKKLPEEVKLERLQRIEATYRPLSDIDSTPYAPLTNAMINTMAQSGMTFGAHTKTHPILGRLAHEDATHEIIESRDIVQAHSDAVTEVFAYPNGQPEDWTPSIERLLQENEFSAALTTLSGTNSTRTPRYELKRYTMDNTDLWDEFLATESGFRGIVQALRTWL